MIYSDAGAGTAAYNVQVEQQTYVYGDQGNDQYLIQIYNFLNDSDEALTNFIAGVFLDFDLPSDDSSNDYGMYDETNDVVYMQPDNSSDPGLYIGLTALGGIQTPWVIDNTIEDNNSGFYFGLYDGFTDEEKWDALSVGVTSRGSDNREVSSSDVSISASAGSIRLDPDEQEKVGFVIAYGVTKSDMLNQIDNARQRAEDRQLTAIEQIDTPSGSLPKQSRIAKVYPNPFNPVTSIRYQLDQAAQVELNIYNRLGQRIQTLQNGRQSAGFYRASFNGSTLASGVYYVILKANGLVVDRKAVTLVK
jgi:hypothetical protein